MFGLLVSLPPSPLSHFVVAMMTRPLTLAMKSNALTDAGPSRRTETNKSGAVRVYGEGGERVAVCSWIIPLARRNMFRPKRDGVGSVSYTHLTLPTILLV